MKHILFIALFSITSCFSQEINDNVSNNILEKIVKSSVVVLYEAQDFKINPAIGILVQKNNLVMVTDDKILEANKIFLSFADREKNICDVVAYDFTRGIALLKTKAIVDYVDPIKLNFQSEFIRNTAIGKHLIFLENLEITDALKEKNSWKFLLETPDSLDTSEDEILININNSLQKRNEPSYELQNSVAKQPTNSESATFMRSLSK